MDRWGIRLDYEEQELLIYEYDPSGAARALDVRELDEAFAEWRSEEWRGRNLGRRAACYAEFDDHCRGHGQRGYGHDDRDDRHGRDRDRDRRDDRGRDHRGGYDDRDDYRDDRRDDRSRDRDGRSRLPPAFREALAKYPTEL